MRKLGIPTVTDRTIQQAMAQQMIPIFEPLFSDGSSHEVSQPHPTLFFSEAYLMKEEYRLSLKNIRKMLKC